MKNRQYRKKCVYGFLRKMYKLFHDKPDIFSFHKLRGYQGICDYEEDSIRLDYRKEFISTLVHECVHYIYPDYSETKVIREEKIIMNTITDRQVRNIIKRFAQFL